MKFIENSPLNVQFSDELFRRRALSRLSVSDSGDVVDRRYVSQLHEEGDEPTREHVPFLQRCLHRSSPADQIR